MKGFNLLLKHIQRFSKDFKLVKNYNKKFRDIDEAINYLLKRAASLKGKPL